MIISMNPRVGQSVGKLASAGSRGAPVGALPTAGVGAGAAAGCTMLVLMLTP